MPAIAITIAKLLGSTLMSMAAKLMTEKFVKYLIIKVLEAIVKSTETKEDDKILTEMKKQWEK
jgi:hypothetical protein